MTSMTGNFTHNSRRPCLGNQKAQRARPPPRPARPVGTGEEGALARALVRTKRFCPRPRQKRFVRTNRSPHERTARCGARRRRSRGGPGPALGPNKGANKGAGHSCSAATREPEPLYSSEPLYSGAALRRSRFTWGSPSRCCTGSCARRVAVSRASGWYGGGGRASGWYGGGGRASGWYGEGLTSRGSRAPSSSARSCSPYTRRWWPAARRYG